MFPMITCRKARHAHGGRNLACLVMGALHLVLGCTQEAEHANSVSARDDGGPTVASDGGCLVIEGPRDDSSVCRRDWSCRQGGLVGVVCASDDAGTRCVCLIGNKTTTTVTPASASVCVDDGGLESVARNACGWLLP